MSMEASDPNPRGPKHFLQPFGNSPVAAPQNAVLFSEQTPEVQARTEHRSQTHQTFGWAGVSPEARDGGEK